MSEIVALPHQPRAADRAAKLIEEIVEIIARAEDIAYRRALADADISLLQASNLILNHEVMHGLRARLYVAQVRRALTKA